MIKYDNVWSQAEPEALQLKQSGYTPQQICTALAKKYFGDADKYNTVKGWHTRRFPNEWPSAETKGGIKHYRKPTRYVYPQEELQGSVPYQQRSGYSFQNAPAVLVSQHLQDDFKCTPNVCFREASTDVTDLRHRQNSRQRRVYCDVPQLSSAVTVDTYYPDQIHDYQEGGFFSQVLSKELDSEYELGELFPDLAEDITGIENVQETSPQDGDVTLSFDDQPLDIQDNEVARQPDLAPHSQISHPLRNAYHRRVPQNPDPLAIVSRKFQAHPASNLQRLDCSLEAPHETEQPFAKHYGTKLLHDKPNPAPQYPLPLIPAMKIGAIHKGYNEKSWRPIGVKESKITKIDPDEFPTDHRRKRAKGYDGREFRDSIALWQLQHNTPNLVPQENPAPEIMQINAGVPETIQIDEIRNPAIICQERSSKISVHSDSRDSGYASVFEPTIDSMRSSFSSLNLAEDVDFKTNCTETDDGFVDVKLKAKFRMRLSYLKKLRDAPLNGLDSENMTA